MEELLKYLEANTSEIGSFHFQFNPHKESHMTLKEHIELLDVYDFANEADKEKCINENRCYSLHWYKDTQVGFIGIAGSSVEILWKFLRE